MYDYMYVTLANTLPDSKCVATFQVAVQYHIVKTLFWVLVGWIVICVPELHYLYYSAEHHAFNILLHVRIRLLLLCDSNGF